MAVRAKFRLDEIHHLANNTRRFIFYPVTADGIPENDRFCKYTPSGKLELWVDNPAIMEWKIGDFYYADFTPTTREGN